MGRIGRLVQQPEGFKAFIPYAFPPAEELKLPPVIQKKHAEAMRLIGKLDGITALLPDINYFLEMFVRRDASSSSQIEGTRATLSDAIEATNVEPGTDRPDDVNDILHYINALDYGLKRAQNFPFSLRFICELHQKLMTNARTTHNAYPGEFRRTQNWIGGTMPSNARFVPPPVSDMKRSLDDFEKFIHADDNYLPLVKAGMLHAQFETIHPFADGNGRTGRMIVTMFLWYQKLLEVPVLYLSSYFKSHQDVYYERLNSYHSETGDVSGWLDFFLDGVIEIAQSSIDTCRKITELRERDMCKVQQLGKVAAPKTLDMLKLLYRMPVVGVADVIKETGYSRQGAYNMIERLMKMKILYACDNTAEYGQKYEYRDYLNLFQEVEDEQYEQISTE